MGRWLLWFCCDVRCDGKFVVMEFCERKWCFPFRLKACYYEWLRSAYRKCRSNPGIVFDITGYVVTVTVFSSSFHCFSLSDFKCLVMPRYWMIMWITFTVSGLWVFTPFRAHFRPLLRAGRKWALSGVNTHNPSKVNVIPLLTTTWVLYKQSIL